MLRLQKICEVMFTFAAPFLPISQANRGLLAEQTTMEIKNTATAMDLDAGCAKCCYYPDQWHQCDCPPDGCDEWFKENAYAPVRRVGE